MTGEPRLAKVRKNVLKIQAIRPGMRVLRVSAKTRQSMTDWLELLAQAEEATSAA